MQSMVTGGTSGRGEQNLCSCSIGITVQEYHAQKQEIKQGITPVGKGVKAMAKDGTNRGGARVGAGRKAKALTDKINGDSAAMVIDLPELSAIDGADMPPAKDYLKAKQKSGKDLCAAEVYEETWKWLKREAVKGL